MQDRASIIGKYQKSIILWLSLEFCINYKSPHILQKSLALFLLHHLTNWDQQDGPVATFQQATYSGLLNLTNGRGHHRGAQLLRGKITIPKEESLLYIPIRLYT